MQTKSPAFDYRRELEVLHQKYSSLVERAGIEEDIERYEQILEPYYFDEEHLPPLFTDAYLEASKQFENKKFEYYRLGFRRLIFGVKKESLRRELIAIVRKFHALSIKACQHDFREAEKRRGSIDDGNRTATYAAIGSVVIVLSLWSVSTALGVAASVFALVYATYDVHYRDRQIGRRTDLLEKEIAGRESALNDELRKEIFTLYEEIYGCAEDGST